MPDDDTTSDIEKDGGGGVQHIVGTLLYYVRSTDFIMLTAINTIVEQNSKPTEQTDDTITQILCYAETHPNPIIRYKSRDVVLHVHSDAS